MNKLTVGDTVKWRGGFGGDAPKDAKVESIEINCEGKYGDDVSEVAWGKVNSRSVNISLDNGHWCYGTQISRKG